MITSAYKKYSMYARSLFFDYSRANLSASASAKDNLDVVMSFYALDQFDSVLVISCCFDFYSLSVNMFVASFSNAILLGC